MHTLFDFISNVNAMQYALAILFVLGFVIFCEVLKPRPFEGLLKSAADDVRFITTHRKEKVVPLIKNIALAPVYIIVYLIAVPVLFYLAVVPVLFSRGMAVPVGKMFADVTFVRWSPVRAYFTGRRKAKKKASEDNPGQGPSD